MTKAKREEAADKAFDAAIRIIGKKKMAGISLKVFYPDGSGSHFHTGNQGGEKSNQLAGDA